MSSKSYTPPFLIFRLSFAFPPSNFLGIFIRVVSFRSFTLFVYARFLRPQALIVVVRALLWLLLLLIHYFVILVVLKYRRTLFKRSSLWFPIWMTREEKKWGNELLQNCLFLLSAGVCFTWFSLSRRPSQRGEKIRHVCLKKRWSLLDTRSTGLFGCVSPTKSTPTKVVLRRTQSCSRQYQRGEFVNARFFCVAFSDADSFVWEHEIPLSVLCLFWQ